MTYIPPSFRRTLHILLTPVRVIFVVIAFVPVMIAFRSSFGRTCGEAARFIVHGV